MNNVQYIKALNTFISLDEVFSELSKQLFSYLPRIIFLGNQKVFDWIKNMLLFFPPISFCLQLCIARRWQAVLTDAANNKNGTNCPLVSIH